MSSLKNLAVIAGAGIGPEVIDQALRVLDVVLPGVQRTEYDLGARRYHASGELLTEETIEELRGYDAILLGAIGDPSVPSGVLERGLLLKLRFALDHHVNLRPGRLYPGVDSPLSGVTGIDFVVVREGTEGPYTGNGGALRVGTPHEVATEVSVNTAFGVERVVRDAFARAQTRRKHLTLVHKTNVLTFAGSLWSRVVAEVGAEYPDVEVAYQHIDAATIAPHVTWGTLPDQVAPIDGRVPDPAQAGTAHQRQAQERALAYMGLEPGQPLTSIPIDVVFIGSCTNGRIEDLRAAAELVTGRKVASRVRALVVPGSGSVRDQAEAEGLDRVFIEAGFEWREPGCSMCLGMNGDLADAGERCASTSNRNFEGRQGRGARTHLLSPVMAAAAAIDGHLSDVRRHMRGRFHG